MISEAHCIDCLEFMKQQPDKRFDLVVADPPYGDPNNIIGGGTIRRVVREVFRGIALQGDGGRGITIKNTPPPLRETDGTGSKEERGQRDTDDPKPG